MDEYVEIIQRFETSNKIVKESIKQLMIASKCMDDYVNLLKNPFKLMICNDIEKELDKYTNQINYYMYLAGYNMKVAGEYLGGNKDGEENKNDRK